MTVKSFKSRTPRYYSKTPVTISLEIFSGVRWKGDENVHLLCWRICKRGMKDPAAVATKQCCLTLPAGLRRYFHCLVLEKKSMFPYLLQWQWCSGLIFPCDPDELQFLYRFYIGGRSCSAEEHWHHHVASYLWLDCDNAEGEKNNWSKSWGKCGIGLIQRLPLN